MNAKRLPANLDARSSEEKARALVMADAAIINEFNRRVAANIERRWVERIKRKWEAA